MYENAETLEHLEAHGGKLFPRLDQSMRFREMATSFQLRRSRYAGRKLRTSVRLEPRARSDPLPKADSMRSKPATNTPAIDYESFAAVAAALDP